MNTPSYRTPGIYVQNILLDPVRELRTGVPLFVGLVTLADLEERNARLPEGKKFFTLPLEGSPAAGPAVSPAVSIVRKEDHARLTPRDYSPAAERYGRDKSSLNQKLMLRAGEPLPADGAEVSRKPQRYTLWPQFRSAYGDLARVGLLTYSVQGFFENEGDLCYVQVFCFAAPITYPLLSEALATLRYEEDFDLICAPDLAWVEWQRTAGAGRSNGQEPAAAPGSGNGHGPADPAGVTGMTDGMTGMTDSMATLQMAVIDHCREAGNRMAILDTPRLGPAPRGDVAAVQNHALDHRRQIEGDDAALYFPWVRVKGGPPETGGFVPPCGHVAGIFNRSDARVGVHKAPANELVEGVTELEFVLDAAGQEPLNDVGINCLRVFGGRGVRVWGARTLSSRDIWRYVNVRRVMLTAGRWIERNLRDVLFEPHTPRLWERVTRDITAYLSDLARHGALQSGAGGALFYVKCDGETNPPEQRETGVIVTEIGMVAAPPAERIIIRLIHGPAGVRIEGPV